MTSFCAESSEKKLGCSTIFHELKSVVKTKIAQNNSQVSEGGITVKPGQEQGRNMVYGLRVQSPKYDWDQGSEERAQGSEEWDQGSQGFWAQIRDQIYYTV